MGYDSAVFRATTLLKKVAHIIILDCNELLSVVLPTLLGQPVINRMPAEAQYRGMKVTFNLYINNKSVLAVVYGILEYYGQNAYNCHPKL